MAGSSVFTEIQIEIIVLFPHSQFFNTVFQLFVIVLSLTSSDNLANPGNKAVHGSNGFPVLVQFHVKGLDLLRIIRDKHRFFEDFLCQIALMLCLQVASPEHLVFKLVVVFHEDIYSLGIGHMAEFGIQHMVQTVQETFIHEGVEEVHLLRSILQHIADHIFQHGLGQLHVVLQIREGDLGLDHPELCRMAGRIGILRTEGGTEGVDIPEGLCKDLGVQLAADRKIGAFSKEILRKVYFSLPGLRYIRKIQGSYLEHFAGAFCVASGNQRGMYIHKASFLEEAVDGVSAERTDTKHCLEGIGSGTEMRHRPQELQRMSLLLKRIVRRGGSLHGYFFGLDLKGLLCVRCRHQRTLYQDCCSYVQAGDLSEILHGIMIYHLQGLKISAIMQHDKAEGFGVPDAPDPAADADLFSQVFFPVSVYVFYSYKVHVISVLFLFVFKQSENPCCGVLAVTQYKTILFPAQE